MSDAVDREVKDTKEEILGASTTGTKVSSVRLEDENGKLLWSPDDIGIYSEVRTSIISYILHQLINDMARDSKSYLKIEDIHHTDGAYTKSEMNTLLDSRFTSLQEMIANTYLPKDDLDLEGLIGRAVEDAVDNYINTHFGTGDTALANHGWVESITGKNIVDVSSGNVHITLKDLCNKLIIVLSRLSKSCFDLDYSQNVNKSDTIWAEEFPASSYIFRDISTLTTRVGTLGTSIQSLKDQDISLIREKIGVAQDGSFESFERGINQTSIIGAINSLSGKISTIGVVDNLSDIDSMLKAFNRGDILQKSNISTSNTETSITKVPASSIFKALYDQVQTLNTEIGSLKTRVKALEDA